MIPGLHFHFSNSEEIHNSNLSLQVYDGQICKKRTLELSSLSAAIKAGKREWLVLSKSLCTTALFFDLAGIAVCKPKIIHFIMEFKKRKAELQLTQENVDEVEAAYTDTQAPVEGRYITQTSVIDREGFSFI